MRASIAWIHSISMILAVSAGLPALAIVSNCGGTGGSGGRLGDAGGAGSGATSGGLGGMPGVIVNQCPNGGVLDCTVPLTLNDGVVSDFSAMQWSALLGKYCDSSGLRGSPFGYPTPSTGDAGQTLGGTASVDTAMRNLKVTLGVAPGGYAGGGISFESCVDASSFNAIQFSAALTAGSFNGCVWQVRTPNSRRATVDRDQSQRRQLRLDHDDLLRLSGRDRSRDSDGDADDDHRAVRELHAEPVGDADGCPVGRDSVAGELRSAGRPQRWLSARLQRRDSHRRHQVHHDVTPPPSRRGAARAAPARAARTLAVPHARNRRGVRFDGLW